MPKLGGWMKRPLKGGDVDDVRVIRAVEVESRLII